jgi:magnesium-transporting ATPase (P-type)
MGEFLVKQGYDFEEMPLQKGLPIDEAHRRMAQQGPNVGLGAPNPKMVCRCVRGGQLISLRSKELVPGDLILLDGRAVVPADARIVSVLTGKGVKPPRNVASRITGEVDFLDKGPEPDGASIYEAQNILLATSKMVGGNCAAVVISTGSDTVAAHVNAVDDEDVRGGFVQNCCVVA